ncbi:MAG: glycosyltransferase family 1 protein [Oscillospiraceae bacterium]|nr:glycosyltransferase family 1 protein [Oscillospiraceae bacterium]
MKHIFIIGSKGIPASYGGFETFVDKLTANRKSDNIKYYVACMSDNNDTFEYNNAQCFNVKIPSIGSAKAVYYDIAALKRCISYIKENNLTDCIIYVLACRIGPFIGRYKKQLSDMNVRLYVNPDGHEWKRDKWNAAIRKYWKISEKLMVKYADLLICDSKNIEKYIQNDYAQFKPATTFIAYGADKGKSELADNDKKLNDWYTKFGLSKGSYYLVVGRFVPENNYETMIREFMKSSTSKSLVLITNVEKNKFYEKLRETTGFEKDKRIRFVGTVYDDQLLKKIREDAYGYFHGHEVGGTNPSLLEALSYTDLNLLLGVGFNREVAEDGALYWDKSEGNLASLIERCDKLDADEILSTGMKAKKRISDYYNWDYIVDEYERTFNSDKGVKSVK